MIRKRFFAMQWQKPEALAGAEVDTMQLNDPLTKLPVRFDAERLAAEVAALPPSAWTPHPSGYAGNEAVRLVTPNGQDTDALFGPMAATEHLLRCPYVMDSMAELGAVWGRSRLMGLAPGSDVPAHIDVNYYWRTHIRVHIPVITNPGVEFTCGEQTVHMRAGECWVLDTFRNHTVVNRGAERRIHLVIDTVGGQRLWDLIRQGESGAAPRSEIVPPSGGGGELQFERRNSPEVMSPWELKCHISDLLGRTQAGPRLEQVRACLDRFTSGWAALWARLGDDAEGVPDYSDLIDSVRDELAAIGGAHLLLSNDRPLYFALDVILFINATGHGPGRARRLVFSREPAPIPAGA